MEKMITVALKNDDTTREHSIARFEELFGIRYCHHLEFANWEVESWMRRACAKAYKRGKIGQLALWLGRLHGKEIDEKTVPDITIRWIGEEIGYGAFASRAYKKWEYIGEYTGILRRRKLIFPDVNDYCFMYPTAWVSLKAFTIDSKDQGCSTRFINHRDMPNCESVAVFHDGLYHIIFRTTQAIAAGTEFTYDYGDIYWHRRKKLPEEPIESLIDPDDLKTLQGFPITDV